MTSSYHSDDGTPPSPGLTAIQRELERRIAESQLNERRLEAVLCLNHMADGSLQEITDFALEQAVALTCSKIGYLAFMDHARSALVMYSWSKSAMQQCAIADKPLVYPLETTGLWGEAVRQRRSVVTNDYAAPNPWKKGTPEGHCPLIRHMNVPIFDGQAVVIVAGVGNKETDYDPSDVRQLTLLMEGVWTIIQRQRVQAELTRHREQLEQLVESRTGALVRSEAKHRHLSRTLRQLLQASDHERQLIAYEIHDGLAQHLAAAVMHLEASELLKDSDSSASAAAFSKAVALLRESQNESRRLIAGVRSPILDKDGVVAAIKHLVHEESGRREGVKIQFRNETDFGRLIPVVENAIYRIVQEALTNACKYSCSPAVRIRLRQKGPWVCIVIRDWGVGFDPRALGQESYGLAGIRQRARLLGGRCSIRSIAGRGTRIAVELPLTAAE